MKIHVEVFIASRILENNQGSFSPQELVDFIEREFHDTRHGIQTHVTASCVANAPKNFFVTYNYLWREDFGKYRTFRPGQDQPAQGKENSASQPKKEDIPEEYRYLLDQTRNVMFERPIQHVPQKPLQRSEIKVEQPQPVIVTTIRENNSYRSSASFGKRQEYIAVAELLRRGHDVYMTLVDDQQIDCVIRQARNGQLRYLDIQIKARSFDARNPGLFAAMEVRAPRENFFYIFYSEAANTYWIIPSLELVREANQNKEGLNKGKFSITFANIRKDGVKPRPRFTKYENAFELLEWVD